MRVLVVQIFPLVRSAIRTVLQICFPPRCSFCDRIVPLDPAEPPRCCGECVARTDWLPHPLIRRPLAGGSPFSLQALCRFDGPVQHALHRLKFGTRRDVARGLAGMLASHLPHASYDAIIPVPLGRARLRERGYNQSALLAAALAQWRALDEPVAHWLMRVRETRPQVGLTAAARQRNIRAAFACTVPRSQLSGRRILLIDDVCTTGATLAAGVKIFRRKGADVTAAVIAVV